VRAWQSREPVAIRPGQLSISFRKARKTVEALLRRSDRGTEILLTLNEPISDTKDVK
jgi:hypothetical protein